MIFEDNFSAVAEVVFEIIYKAAHCHESLFAASSAGSVSP